ncbi:hypothetical protein JVU11DRAFT_10468 [Chiua virens]|nr:hypothetical protein JVU11DRAFT_10468 [Chiua virens]
MWSIFGFALLSTVLANSTQQPLSRPSSQDVESNEYYQFRWPIRRVAIIGAGPSGLVAFRELKEAGLEVRIFERDNAPGGIWHYSEEISLDSPVPNAAAAVGDFEPSLPPADVELPHSEEFEDNGQGPEGP